MATANARGRKTPRTQVFVSYNTLDREPARVVVELLAANDIQVIWDQGGFAVGELWVPELERMLKTGCDAIVLCLGPNGMGWWQYNELGLALDRKKAQPEFPVIPVLMPEAEPGGLVLALLTWIDLREGPRDEAASAALVAACRRKPFDERERRRASQVKESIIPYRGLSRFREEDAPLFFGRDAFVERIAVLTRQRRLVAVVGPSGSGKSSVVHAGLFPRLRQEHWRILWMVPGDRPVRNLASIVIQALERKSAASDALDIIRKANSLADDFRKQNVMLRDIIEQISFGAPGTGILLLVDQWEELYTLSSPDECRCLLDQLFSVLDRPDQSPLSVVLTLRADFFEHAIMDRHLADLIQVGLVNLGPMRREELRAAIEKPVLALGLELEEGLVELILDEVKTEPNALPLVEFLLEQLWRQRRGTQLTHDAYRELNGVKGSIAHVAESLWVLLETDQQEVAMQIFLRLAQVKIDAQATRRRAPLHELTEKQLEVARKLVDRRILVTARNASTGEEFLDVAHEALMTNWSRLDSWLQEHREFLLWHQRLEFALQDWKKSRASDDALLVGPRLDEAARWLTERPSFLIEEEKVFIRRSSARSEHTKEGERLRLEASRRIADSELLEKFTLVSEQLWPPYPERIPGLEALITEVEGAVAHIPELAQLLGRLEQRLLIDPSAHVRWQRDQIERLLSKFRGLEQPEAGILPSLRRRLSVARSIYASSIGSHSLAWENAIRWIAAQPAYRGLTLVPQLGLVPLGTDPTTGLMEFLHLLSHAGELPTRDSSGSITLTEECGMILVLLPGGVFTMGAQSKDPKAPNFDPRAEQNEAPPNRVDLDAFFVSKYLVTQSQWFRITGSNPSRYQPGASDARGVVSLLHPVEEVSLLEAQKALRQVGLLLPTEAQWEYAARGGEGEDPLTGFSLQGPPNDTVRQAVNGVDAARTRRAHADESTQYTNVHAPVGAYEPNAYGIYDMLGNVWELTRDFSASYLSPADKGDGLRGKEGRFIILRGGSYFNSLAQLRVTWRTDDATPTKAAAWLGVRAVRAWTVPE